MYNLSLFDNEGVDSDFETKLIDETYLWKPIKHIIERLPEENNEILPGVKWGHHGILYTPAYWKVQFHMSEFSTTNVSHRLCENIIDEIAFCLLGGYGMKSEIGDAAYKRLKENGALRQNVPYEEIYYLMSLPFNINGKKSHYRFHNQKSKYLHKLFLRKDLYEIPTDNDLRLRKWLLSVDGIGYKTASWITRNWLKSDNVAILDIHIIRAGILMGIFDKKSDPINNYLELERKYIDICHALNVPPSDLDAIIWYEMKNNSKLAISLINYLT